MSEVSDVIIVGSYERERESEKILAAPKIRSELFLLLLLKVLVILISFREGPNNKVDKKEEVVA